MANNFRVTVRNLEPVRARFILAGKSIDKRLQDALMEEMEIEKEEVRNRVPVDTGALRDSTKLIEGPGEGKSNKKGQIAATILVGDDSTNPKTGMPTRDYAARVHEDLEVFHNVGQAKYVESVVRESGPYMAERVMKRVGKIV